MENSELAVEDSVADHHARRTATEPVGDRRKSSDPQRLRCADVARNRAARYAKRHSTPKPLWPLIAAAIMIGLIVERRPIPIQPWARKRPSSDNDAIGPESSDQASDRGDHDPTVWPTPGGADGAIGGDPKPQYRPPPDFLAKDTAQLVSFLIRNKGRVDNPAVRAKWDYLDRASLPLAIYLRDVEANAAWDALEKEIADTPTDLSIMPKSLRHRKILQLVSDWERHGEELLSGAPADDPVSEPTPPVDDDDPDVKPRKP